MHEHAEFKKDGGCPCGSGVPYEECCKPYHDGAAWPGDPETMVRARYCAYAVQKWQFLVDTQLPSSANPGLTAEQLAERASDVQWQGLNIVGSGISEEDDERGNPYVDFYAYYYLPNGLHQVGEQSYFTTKDGKLYYTSGVQLAPEPVRNAGPKVGRNDPCPCGSGKKYKKCCGRSA
ncbi:MAG: YchJ family metal-binding protein [Desulfovibrionaceae bacterium]|nr:YchJ family metal-binding protein [Desulfovibrionaceae bacterium]